MTRELPTRADLDAKNEKSSALVAVAIVTFAFLGAVWWWQASGLAAYKRLLVKADVLHLWWTLVATPAEKQLLLVLAATLVALVVAALWFLHRFYWRALFPDLVRVDPTQHKGGRPERIGRLYRTRAFREEDGSVRYRLHFKHHARGLFPLLRFDTVDVAEPPTRPFFGVAEIRAGRLDRDPAAGRFRRLATPGAQPSAPLGDAFRASEVKDDSLRKTAIVLPGATTNPEVVRDKFRDEPMVSPWVHRDHRRVLGRRPSNRPVNNEEGE